MAREEDPANNGWRILARGLVQGVGFRPAVWQAAHALGVRGSVRNTSDGVVIEMLGGVTLRTRFLAALEAGLPPLARLDALHVEPHSFSEAPAGFSILESEPGPVTASVVADAKLCAACEREIFDPADRRFGHTFANCTHCGPRLSIIRAIPYDRANTAMAAFEMCAACRAEYENPADRRFHAEPTSCPDCGPRLWLETADGKSESAPILQAARILQGGGIVALKGIGGFHLACDAASETAVLRLRHAKHRLMKPLAVMARDIKAARQLADISEEEAAIVEGPRGPVMLVRRRNNAAIAPSVAPGQDRIGLMLPTSPLHALLMDAAGMALVMTSANESGLPQCVANDEARALLGSAADAVLLNDRDIVSRVDDSVVRLDTTGPAIIRRARGYAPEPLLLPQCLEGRGPVFAAGADLKSAFAFAGAGEALLSQHMGDLGDAATRTAYSDAVRLYAQTFGRKPLCVAVDSHPAYASSAIGAALAQEWNVPLVFVQHHHAHLAACMAENGCGGEAVLGIILDGAGHGQDGTVWGGEFLKGSYAGFERAAHFDPVPLIGGDMAALEPWRSGLAHLDRALGETFTEGPWADLPPVRSLRARPLAAVRSVSRSRRLSPLSSSAGRLFDAAAWLTGIAPERLNYEGQAAMELEALARPHMASARSHVPDSVSPVLGWRSLWQGMLEDMARGRPPHLLAADFHLTLIEALHRQALAICHAGALNTAALSGGVFQNAILLEGLHARLTRSGLKVLLHHKVPANDGGIALGQSAVALSGQF